MGVLLKLDKWVNHKIFRGHEDETISSRLGRKIEEDNCVGCRLFCRTVLLPLAIIFKQGAKHCRAAIQDEHRE